MTPAVAALAQAVAAALDDPAFAAAVQLHRVHPTTVLAEPLLDANDVAELLRVPPSTVRQYARDGRLPSRPIGRHVRFVRAEVEQAVLSGRLI